MGWAVFWVSFLGAWPIPLLGSLLTVRLVEMKATSLTIGAFSLLHIPYSLAFLWGPLLTKGFQRRTYITLSATLLSGVLMTMAWYSPWLPWSVFLGYLLVGVLYMGNLTYEKESVQEKNYGIASSAAVAGYRLGLTCSATSTLFLATFLGWHIAYLIGACFLFIGSISILFLPEPLYKPEYPPQPQTHFFSKNMWLSVKNFFTQHHAVTACIFLLLYRLGEGCVHTFIYPFYIDRGFSKPDVALAVKTFGVANMFLGAYISGITCKRIGVEKSLFLFGWLHACSYLFFPFLPPKMEGGLLYFYLLSGMEHMTTGMKTTAFVAFLWKIVLPSFASIQYALLWSFLSIISSLLSFLMGFIIGNLGWNGFFILAFIVSLPGLWYLKGTFLREKFLPN